MNEDGFTLVELMVVIAIIGLLTGFMATNFSRSKVDLNREALALSDAVRSAQSNALSGIIYASQARCGYGIHFDPTSGTYWTFAGQNSSVGSCASQYYVFNDNNSTPTMAKTDLSTSNLILSVSPSGNDIFFVPPNPTTFIAGDNGSGQSNQSEIFINISRAAGAVCPGSDCRVVHVTSSGQISIQ